MRKLLLIICCLGFFFSIHAQDDPVKVSTPIKADNIVAMPMGELAITPPKFPECNCAGYNVGISKGDNAMVDMKNGSTVIFQDGESLIVKKELKCNSGVAMGETNCATCQNLQWKIIDEAGNDLTTWSGGEVPPTIGIKMKCDVNYKLVLQGRCGCTLCPPFIVNLKKSCCNCNALNTKMAISGISQFCLTKDCNQIFTYTVPTLEPSKCFTYTWNIKNEMGINVSFSGQSSNTISFSCKALRAGTYFINLTIKCQDKIINLTKQLVLCEKPNALFTAVNSGSSSSSTPNFPAQYDYWILIDDLDDDCKVSAGDVPHSINNTPMTWTLLTPPTPFSFSDLAVGKSYLILHLSFNICGNSYCSNSYRQCYRYDPQRRMMEPEVTPFDIMELPAQIRKGLPKKVFEMRSTTDIEN